MADIDVSSAQQVTPPKAPPAVPLTGRERAGIQLTFVVLAIIAAFLLLVLLALWWNESRSAALSAGILQGTMDEAKLKAIADERAAFRTFWLEVTKTILLNVFLPVLTALLGYVFGTTQISRSSGPP
jgi:hypothetical protein